ncbi:unnamed protein product [Ostreobium quekettii]|uniref:Uncharacterized protein n=1 Tax=Ostreobium quekettii TaxID=121088 RepID=A0A8S1IP30_9CHLO|nr:unnamed protein product [Ostreobium quekettii]
MDPNFATFLEHFGAQLAKLGRYYSPQLHGDCDLKVEFGRSYVRRPPPDFVEDGSVAVGALLKALQKKGGSVHPAWMEAAHARRACTRRHTARWRAKQSATSSFISELPKASMSRLDTWLQAKGLVDQGAAEAKYVLFVTRDGADNVVWYDEGLRLMHVLEADFRWVVTDVKRAYKPRGNAIMDGDECDVRFILRSQPPPGDGTRQAAAVGLHDALSWPVARQQGEQAQMPSVKKELMDAGQALSLKHERRRTFRSNEAGGILSRVQVELTEYDAQARPAGGRFPNFENYHDLQLRIPADVLLTGDSGSTGNLLESVWSLAFEISNVIQNQCV